MTSRGKPVVRADLADPNRGRIDPKRIGQPVAVDSEERPVITLEDIEATRAELAELKQRATRRNG
jgi:hypothetical protein